MCTARGLQEMVSRRHLAARMLATGGTAQPARAPVGWRLLLPRVAEQPQPAGRAPNGTADRLVAEDGLLGSGLVPRPDHGPEPAVELVEVLGLGHGALHRVWHGVEVRGERLDDGCPRLG